MKGSYGMYIMLVQHLLVEHSFTATLERMARLGGLLLWHSKIWGYWWKTGEWITRHWREKSLPRSTLMNWWYLSKEIWNMLFWRVGLRMWWIQVAPGSSHETIYFRIKQCKEATSQQSTTWYTLYFRHLFSAFESWIWNKGSKRATIVEGTSIRLNIQSSSNALSSRSLSCRNKLLRHIKRLPSLSYRYMLQCWFLFRSTKRKR